VIGYNNEVVVFDWFYLFQFAVDFGTPARRRESIHMAKKVNFGKRPKAKGKKKRDPLAFEFGANVRGGKKRRGFGGGS
jgi:hypothetical protein